jgi:hypothetical protein
MASRTPFLGARAVEPFQWVVVGLILLVSALAILTSNPLLYAEFVVVGIAVVGLFSASSKFLLTGSLAATVCIPVTYVAAPRVLAFLPPSLLLATLFYMRSRGAPESRSGPLTYARVAGFAFILWLVMSLTLTTGAFTKGLVFAAALALGVVAPAAFRIASQADADFIKRIWATAGVAVGLYASVETFILKRNPIWGGFYETAHIPLVQKWSVYRATTGLGHPLVNGTFLAVAVVLLADRAISRLSFRTAVGLVFASAGLVATASRSGLYAGLIGIVILIASAFLRGGRRRTNLLKTLPALALALLATTFVIANSASRSGTAESESSARYRDFVVVNAVTLAKQHAILGFGPGESHSAQEQFGVYKALPIENTYGELLVSLGFPGLILFGLFVLLITGEALIRGDVGAGAALVALGVSVSGYNALEGQPQVHVLWGLLLFAGTASWSARRERTLFPAASMALEDVRHA